MKYEFKMFELYSLMSKSEKVELVGMLIRDGFCVDKKMVSKTCCKKNVATTPKFSADKYVSVKYKYNASGEYTGKYTITPNNYYGEKVYSNDDYYTAAQKTLAKEGYKLKEIRSMSALNRTENHNMVGVPQPGFGKYNWCQIVVENVQGQEMTSGWVFRYDDLSPAYFAQCGAGHCANFLVNYHAFRCAVLDSLCLGVQR